MAKSKRKPIEQYEHLDKKRKNNPPAGLVTSKTDQDGESMVYVGLIRLGGHLKIVG